MKEVKMVVYVTEDGIKHDSLEKAVRHADTRWGCELCALAGELADITFYGDMAVWVENNHARLQRLLDLNKDRRVERCSEESEDHDDCE